MAGLVADSTVRADEVARLMHNHPMHGGQQFQPVGCFIAFNQGCHSSKPILSLFLIRKEDFSLFDGFWKQLQRNVPASVAITAHVVTLDSLQDVMKIFSVGPSLRFLQGRVAMLPFEPLHSQSSPPLPHPSGGTAIDLMCSFLTT